MKALVLHGIGDLRYEEVDTPQVQDGQALVKIKACGICGSDIPRVLTKGTYHFPTIPGHEFSGEIVQVGKGVSEDIIGKRVTVFPLLPCFECDMCEVGEYAQCNHYNYFGSRCDGGFAEYLSAPIWNLCFANDDADFRELAMTEPCAVGLHALRQAGLNIGDTVCVFGAGPIGLMIAKWAYLWGASKVILIDVDQRKCDFAKKIGQKYVFCGGTKDAIDYVNQVTDNKGADVTIEGAGVTPSFEGAMFVTKYFGKVVLMGNPNKEMTLTQQGYWQILRKQLTVKGTWNSGYASTKSDWKMVVNAINEHKLNLTELITHCYPLEAEMEPFQMISSKREFYNKVMYLMEDK